MDWNCFDILNFFGASSFSIEKIENNKYQRLKIPAVEIPEIYKEYFLGNGWNFNYEENCWFSDVASTSKDTLRPSFSEISLEEIEWDCILEN